MNPVREYQFASGVRLVIRTSPDTSDATIDQVLPGARRVAVYSDGEVWVWDDRGRLVVAYPPEKVIAWWALNGSEEC